MSDFIDVSASVVSSNSPREAGSARVRKPSVRATTEPFFERNSSLLQPFQALQDTVFQWRKMRESVNTANRMSVEPRKVNTGPIPELATASLQNLFGFRKIPPSTSELLASKLYEMYDPSAIDFDASRSAFEQWLTSPKIQAKLQDIPKEFHTQILLQELYSVTSTKLNQTIAEATDIHPVMRTIMEKARSQNEFSRSFDEAQAELNLQFPGRGYKIDKELGAGSLGDAYRIRKQDGTTAVLKMRRKDISHQLELELASAEEILPAVMDKAKSDYYLNYILANAPTWRDELDYNKEAMNYKALLGQNPHVRLTKVVDLAQVDETGKAGAIIYEEARGVSLDKLSEMEREFRANPQAYARKYADKIDAFPALAQPSEMLAKARVQYGKAVNHYLNESLTGHGDMHLGNFFFDGEALTAIDYGAVMKTDAAQRKREMKIVLSMLTGDSKTLSRGIVESLGNENITDTKLVDELAETFDAKLFNRPIQLKDSAYLQKVLDDFFQRKGIALAPEEAMRLRNRVTYLLSEKALADQLGVASNPFLETAKSFTGKPQFYSVLFEQLNRVIQSPRKSLNVLSRFL